MPVSATERVKAQAIAAAFRLLVGESPELIETPDYILIRPTQNQADKIRGMIEGLMAQKPGTVRMETSAILTPIFMKKIGPWILGALAGGFGAGKFLGR